MSLLSEVCRLVATNYGVRKVRGKEEYEIYDRMNPKRVVGRSSTKEQARVAAHIRDDNSKRYPKRGR